jgi:hypothetical protein
MMPAGVTQQSVPKEMEMKEFNGRILPKIEWSVAIMVTGLCVALHYIFMRHAGGLWRDEAGAINLAEMPSLKDVWNHLYFDSFPVFWVLVARFWWLLGLGSDFGFRVLGFLTGLLVLGAIWFTARCFKLKFPLFSLVLVGLNPLMIVYGDTMRAWSWGLIWITLAYGMFWLVLENPTRARVICATLVAVAAVQSTYYNSVLLFVFGCAAAIVAMGRGSWRRAALVLGICAVPAVTMLAYVNVFRIGQDHYSILRQDFDFPRFVEKLFAAISGEEAFSREIISLWVWWLPLIVAEGLAAICQFLPERAGVTNAQKERMLFAVLTLILVGPVYFLFLHELKYVTSPWYYMPLILTVGLSLEVILSTLENWERARLYRLVGLVALLFMAFPPINGVIKLRMTDIDLIATQLKQSAGKNDFIIVNPFYCGISFGRQYSGPAPWLPLPVVDTKVHRYDTLKKLIMQKDAKEAIQDVLDRAQETLKAGGIVWVVTSTGLNIGEQDTEPATPPHYRNLTFKQAQTVQTFWPKETAYFLQQHSLHHEEIGVHPDAPVSNYERAKLVKVSGWRD